MGEWAERLGVRAPPRSLYYGVLGARSAWRSHLRASDPDRPGTDHDWWGVPAEAAASRPRGNWLWAELMQRSFGVDVLACPRCGDRFERIALIEDPLVIRFYALLAMVCDHCRQEFTPRRRRKDCRLLDRLPAGLASGAAGPAPHRVGRRPGPGGGALWLSFSKKECGIR